MRGIIIFTCAARETFIVGWMWTGVRREQACKPPTVELSVAKSSSTWVQFTSFPDICKKNNKNRLRYIFNGIINTCTLVVFNVWLRMHFIRCGASPITKIASWFVGCNIYYGVQNGFVVVRVAINASQAPHFFVRCRSIAHNWFNDCTMFFQQ